MKTFKLGFRNWLVAAFAMFLSANALAAVAYTTLPGPQNGGPCFGAANKSSTGIHTPAGSSYQLDSIQVRLHDTATATSTPFSFDVYDDNGGVPGTLVSTIGTGTGTAIGGGSSTYDLYTVTPGSPIALNANTTYWIVASSSSVNSCAFGWSSNGTNPTGGIFTYVGEEQFTGSDWNNRDGAYQQLEINVSVAAATVPTSIPTLSEWGMIMLSILLALAAVFTLRRQRR